MVVGERAKMRGKRLYECACVSHPSLPPHRCAAVKAARALGPGHTVVTVLCDGGARYMAKVYSTQWLAERHIAPSKHINYASDNADFIH